MALLDITVKTLDGQNRSFSVPEEMTVRSFKEKISNSIEIPADTQRLIFHGRVMNDDKKLKEYDIHGKAVHVVQRAPPSTTNTNDEPSTPNPHAPNADGNMLDVQIHFGGMNTAATSRDARQRIQQAEINVGIINDALNLLEQRTGTTASQCPPDSEDAEDSSMPAESAEENRDTSATQEGANASGADNQSSASQSQEPNTGNRAQETPEGLSATDLADFLDRVLVTSRRMAPHLRMYRDYLRDEESYPADSQGARTAQEVANRVMEAVHAMSHVMHSLSDVMVDMHSSPPRQGTAVPLSPFAMSGTNTMAIPIHMNVRTRPADGNGSGANRGRGSAPTQGSNASNPRPGTAAPRNNSQPAQPSTNMEGIQVQVEEPVVTVHNIQAAVVTDDMLMEEGMHFDVDGTPASTSVNIVSSSHESGQPATSSTTSSTATVTSNEAPRTNTSTSSARTSASNTSATAGFSVGPTTNVNVGGTGIGPLPNVPGLPGAMLQNIVQSILTNHGVQPGHPVQVNVLHPATLGSIHIQQQPRHQGPASATQNRPTSTPQQTSSGSNTNDNSGPTTASSNPGTGPESNPGLNSRSTNTPRPIFINRGGRPAPYPMGPRQAHPRPPGAVPRHGNGGPHGRGFVDMFLPCTSHHYLSQTARNAARTARNQGHQQVPNLSTMVSGMVGDLFGQVGHVHQHVRNNGNRTTSASAGTSVPNTSASTTNTSDSSQSTNQSHTNRAAHVGGNQAPGGRIHAFNPADMLASIIGGPSVVGGPGGPIHVDLTSLVANMMGAAQPQQSGPGNNTRPNPANNNTASTTTTTTTSSTPSGNPMGGTLADLFRQFTSHMGPSGDVDMFTFDQSEPSFIQALIETVAPHVRLTDLFSLVMGNTRVIGQLRGPLQQFVQGRVTQLGSVENVVNSAVEDMNSEIVFITDCVEVRPGVDMCQSIRNCLRYHLQKVINAILSETPASQDEYGRGLYQLWMTMLAEVIALCIYCIRNGQTGFSSMLQQYMPRMTRDLNPAITIWMSTSVQDILSSFHRNHPVPEADILRFVAHPSASATQQVSTDDKTKTEKSSSTTVVQQDSKPTSPPQTDSQDTNSPTVDRTGSTRTVPMEVSESPSSLPPRAKVPRTQQAKESDSGDEFVDAPEEFTSRSIPATRPSQIATSSSARVAGLRYGNGEASSQWQNVVPQEWIPVINQDMERQSEQCPQPPHSDAYLQGLPAKRRRMMVLEHAGEMGNMPQYLPSAIARAARVAGVEPISNEQNLMQEATEEKELHDELEQEVQAIVESRITSDRDFSSDRFPNSIRYFQKPKNP